MKIIMIYMFMFILFVTAVVTWNKPEEEKHSLESEEKTIQETVQENPRLEEPKLEEVQVVKTEVLKDGTNITGKWKGKYKIKEPMLCVAFSSSWTANLKQSDGAFSGKYESLKDGTMSGKITKNIFDGELSGGVNATIKGEVIGDSISGTFIGPKCPGTSKKATGTFTGTKLK